MIFPGWGRNPVAGPVGAVGNSRPRFLRLRVFQGTVKLWETCFWVFHNFMVPAASIGPCTQVRIVFGLIPELTAAA